MILPVTPFLCCRDIAKLAGGSKHWLGSEHSPPKDAAIALGLYLEKARSGEWACPSDGEKAQCLKCGTETEIETSKHDGLLLWFPLCESCHEQKVDEAAEWVLPRSLSDAGDWNLFVEAENRARHPSIRIYDILNAE